MWIGHLWLTLNPFVTMRKLKNQNDTCTVYFVILRVLTLCIKIQLFVLPFIGSKMQNWNPCE